MSLYHIVYLSQATSELDETLLKELLLRWRKTNEARAITGILLYCGNQILQVIEGEEQIVQQLFARIEQDCRHSRVQKLADGLVEQREFPDWSMGFAVAVPQDFALLAGYCDPVGDWLTAGLPTPAESPIRELIRDFSTLA
ncbi:BLUF domain-containing protein [Hymenobacter amundsenii]|nr:BLUF domain-containing protein [Hymenobacter amundsenii]